MQQLPTHDCAPDCQRPPINQVIKSNQEGEIQAVANLCPYLPCTYRGETTVVAAVTGDFCPACAESIFDAGETDRVMREMSAFANQVNAAIVDPAFIVTLRKKLNLDRHTNLIDEIRTA
jgi:hypothetical protein